MEWVRAKKEWGWWEKAPEPEDRLHTGLRQGRCRQKATNNKDDAPGLFLKLRLKDLISHALGRENVV